MRHFSKSHLPNPEWKKVIRFNGKDYLLQSVFDSNSEENKQISIEFPGYEIYRKWFDKVMDDATNARKRSPFLAESYFSEITDEYDEEYEDEDSGSSLLADDEPDEVDTSMSIIVESSIGEEIEVFPSDNAKKNAVFYLLSKIMFIDYPSGCSVDDVLLNAGKHNERESFRIMVDHFGFSKGRIRFVAQKSARHLGNIQVYFTSNDDLRLGITYPGICTVRTPRKEYVSFEGDELRNIIPELPGAMSEISSETFYGNLIGKFLERCPKVHCNFTMLTKTRDFQLQGNPWMTRMCPAFLQNNFKPLGKFSEGKGDARILYDTLQSELNLIDTIRNDIHGNIIYDEYYVLLSGSDYYVQRVESSFLLSADGVDGFRFYNWNGIVGLFFKTPNKEDRMIMDPHHMLIIPFSLFCVMLPVLYISTFN